MDEGSFLDPLLSLVRYVRDLVPSKLSKPSLSFITVHYCYIIGMTIIGSIIVYPKGLDYIDALFFAAGSATQSGLNTVDVNTLHLYQQVTFYLIACVCTPVWIHSTLVVTRLYWFEKRFAKLVKEQRSLRKLQAKTLTRSKSEARTVDLEHGTSTGLFERRVLTFNKDEGLVAPDQLNIGPTAGAVVHDGKTALGGEAQSIVLTDAEDSNRGSDHVASESEKFAPGAEIDPPGNHQEANGKMHRDILFADEVNFPRSDDAQPNGSLERSSVRGSDMARHIEFLERQQRNAHREEGTLRIPGPRDFDRGAVPQELNGTNHADDVDGHLGRSNTGGSSPTEIRRGDGAAQDHIDEHTGPTRAITIDVSGHPAHERHSEDGSDTSSPTLLSRIRTGLTHRPSQSRLGMQRIKESLGKSFPRYGTNTSLKQIDSMPYLSWQATSGRNSAFLGLTSEQRDELGGIEYRSLKMLLKILVGYFLGFQFLGVIVLVPWILNTHWRYTVLPEYAINPTWWGIFTSASMFNDLGLTLTATSMNEFNTATLPLLFGSYLIIVGNTGFPCMLRFLIWTISKFYPRNSPGWDELRFLLDHPRRCFTLLFPSKATWWLFWVLVLLNGIDLVFFIILDLNDPVVTSIPAGWRVLDGWFQAVSTRTAGFSCINIAQLHPAIQVSYLIMMYISVFPIAISVRRTNVYEEKSLGIWGGEENGADDQDPSYVGQHLRRQLSFDLWYIFLGLFIVAIAEGNRLSEPSEYAFTMFSVLFEIVSAYGTVGLSLGYPGINASFSAEFGTISKLVVIAMMIRGRHRGLPYALDRAILLPSDKLHKDDHGETQHKVTRRGSAFSERRASDTRNARWQEGDLDDSGLPRQHTNVDSDPMTAGAGGERDPENLRRVNRRGSRINEHNDPLRRAHRRSRSLGQVIVGGLSAGPTLPRDTG